MTKLGAFLAGLAAASLAAVGVWWVALRPREADAVARAAAAERAAQRAKRDASDAQGWAEHEHRMKLEMEKELSELKKVLTAPVASKPGTMGGHVTPPTDLGGDLAPEQWDDARRRQEMALLAQTPNAVVTNPGFPLVIRAMRKHLDADIPICAQVLAPTSGFPNAEKSVCATLLARLGDPRGVPPLLAAWSTAVDENLRAAVLRGLAELPGTDQTQILVGVWNDPLATAIFRSIAIHGLALRRHPIAISVAEGVAPGSTPPLRLQAMNTLHSEAMKGEWKDTALVAVFGKALLSADGDPQRKLALLALEGFWSKEALADLDRFVESSTTSELAARARKAIDGIRGGQARPEGAGVPLQRAGVVPAETDAPEPADDVK